MKRKALALIAAIFSALFFAAIATAGASRHFGRSKSGHFAGSLKQSAGFRASFGGHGSRSHLSFGGRRIHPHHFGHRKQFHDRKHFHRKKVFSPHRRFHRHHVILPRRGLHGGFFFGPGVTTVGPSSVIIWSHLRASSGYTVPLAGGIVGGERVLERPLVSMMLRHRHELNLSTRQVEDLENLRHAYQREAIRYEGDISIAEMDLQKLLQTDPVDLEQVKGKLQEIERSKAEMRLARIRAIEHGKALLSPEQREKLEALIAESRYSRIGDERLSPPAEDQH